MNDVRTPIKHNGGDWVEKFGELWKSQAQTLQSKMGDAIEKIEQPGECATDVPIIWVKPSRLIELLQLLKADADFEYDFLSDITATDEMPEEPRFHLIYNLLSLNKKCRIRVKTKIAEGEECPTAIPVWPGANWAEREVFDMYGVRFKGHPDMRRILMDVRWEGYPLRKDYPLRGYQIFPTAEPIDPALLDKDGVT